MTIQVAEAGRAFFFNFSEIWVKFLKEVQIEAVLCTHVPVSKMCSSSVVGRSWRCGAPALCWMMTRVRLVFFLFKALLHWLLDG